MIAVLALTLALVSVPETTTSTLSPSEVRLYQTAERARAVAEGFQIELDRCEAEKAVLERALAAPPPAPSSRRGWLWPVALSSLGAGAGAVGGEKLAGRPGAVAGAVVGAMLVAGLGVLVSGL